MEIFDAFCGVGPWAERDPLLPYRADQIIELMDHFGIDRALARPNAGTLRGRAPTANRVLREDIADHPRLIPAFCLAVHPYRDYPSPEDYARSMREAGARAAWLTPQGNSGSGFSIWLVGELLAMCAEHKVPVFVHSDTIDAEVLHELCSEFPSLRLVLASAGYRADRWLFPLLRKHSNLHVCLGHFYIPPGGPMRFLEHFSAERLLFGSGLPEFSPGGLIGHVMYGRMKDSEREMILSGNLKRLISEVEL